MRMNIFNLPAGINVDDELFPQDGVTYSQMDLPK